MADTSAFIIDDTTDARVGRHIENVSYIFDHVVGKTVFGFKDLVLGYFDGKSFSRWISAFMRKRGCAASRAKSRIKNPASRDRLAIDGEKNVPWIKSRKR